MKKSIKSNSYNFTLGLVILDLFPCLFFGASMVVLGLNLSTPVFVIGAVICTLSGLCKVMWKLFIVFADKDVRIMNVQLRALMPVGMLLIIVGGVCGSQTRERVKALITFGTTSPSRWILLAGVILMCLMMVWAFVLDSTKPVSNWIEEITNTLAQFLIMIGIIWLAYASDYYQYAFTYNAEELREMYGVEADFHAGYTAYVPVDGTTQKGLVFYPGGKVEADAYEPMLMAIADKGFVCVLVYMPDNLAILDMKAAEKLDYRDAYPDVNQWYLGGHSLGGATASMYLEGLGDRAAKEYAGLILMGAYSTKDLTGLGVPTMTIYGSEDKVLNIDKYKDCYSNLPEGNIEYIIEGGCHSYFGDYGMQSGDGNPTISPKAQWDTVDLCKLK